MLYVICPCCESRVEVSEAAIGPERTHLWNVVVCDLCDTSFDYDDLDVAEEVMPAD